VRDVAVTSAPIERHVSTGHEQGEKLHQEGVPMAGTAIAVDDDVHGSCDPDAVRRFWGAPVDLERPPETLRPACPSASAAFHELAMS
jgi:hypothetical protein